MVAGVRWMEFAAASPDIAEGGRKLVYQFGVGLGYLATIRRDGGPRLHPFCPVIAEGGLWGLIAPSPKQGDLLRNGLYAIHTFSPEDKDDEFYVTGTALRCDDPARRAAVRDAYLSTGATTNDDEVYFEFLIERALLAIYKSRTPPDNWPPAYSKWVAPSPSSLGA